MRHVTTVTDLKAHLSGWLDRVQAGSDVLVTDRGRPVARIAPVAAQETMDERLAALCRAGVLRAPDSAGKVDLWQQPMPVLSGNRAVEVLLQERDER